MTWIPLQMTFSSKVSACYSSSILWRFPEKLHRKFFKISSYVNWWVWCIEKNSSYFYGLLLSCSVVYAVVILSFSLSVCAWHWWSVWKTAVVSTVHEVVCQRSEVVNRGPVNRCSFEWFEPRIRAAETGCSKNLVTQYCVHVLFFSRI